ncbi:hypothetical protein RugamoR64_21330 [Duganella rhizosphaerae]
MFCGTAETFAKIAAWADGKLLGQTATFGTNEGDELAEAYLLDIHHGAHGDFLVGIWNRLPGNRHHVSSVGIGDVVGAVSAEVTEIDRNRIPGFATYFWVMPAERRVATIGLKHQSHGRVNFINYCGSFLKFINPEHVILSAPAADGSFTIQGYRQSALHDALPGGVRPTFGVESLTSGGDLQFLRDNVGSISKVFCKTLLTTAEPGQRDWWQTLLDVTRIGKAPPVNIEEAQIKVELPVSLTLPELESTIAEWEDDLQDGGGRLQDLGFKVADEIKWLSKSNARDSERLDVQWIDDELVNLEALLGQLQVHRARILRLG